MIPTSRLLPLAGLFAISAPSIYAVPELRLETATVGPISVAVGSNGAAQTVNAFNAGDGELHPALSVSANAAWLHGGAGKARPCTSRAGQCWPLSFSFETAKLSRGVYTGTVTVSDPDAADAPQTITVTVNIGGSVPDKVDLFVAPAKTRNFTLTANGSKDIHTFTTNGSMAVKFAPETGGQWLQISLDGAGTYRFPYPWRITSTYQDGMAEQTYSGTVTTSGSSLAEDNKTIPVTLHVTSQPLGVATPSSIEIRLAADSAGQSRIVQVTNRGLGTLAVSGAKSEVKCTPGSLVAKVSVDASPDGKVRVALDPAGAKPGVCEGAIHVESNAAKPLAIPFTYEIVPRGVPLLYFEGLTESVTRDTEVALAQGGMASVTGEQLTYSQPVRATGATIATTLGGVRVLVNGKAAPVYAVSYGQADFQVPFDTPPGEVLVRVERDGQDSNTVTAQVEPISRRLLRLGLRDYGRVVNADGSFPVPVSLADRLGPSKKARPAKPGDILTIYAMGLGATTPAAVTGSAPTEAGPPARVNAPFKVFFGNRLFNAAIGVEPIEAILAPGEVGVYRIKVRVPDHAAPGDATHLFLYSDYTLSNQVILAIDNPAAAR
jgi:uncharacterized protein (TIGR03437 family)